MFMLVVARFLYLMAAFCLLIACETSPAPTEPAEEPQPLTNNTFNAFVEEMQLAKAGQEIPAALSELYIQSALAKDSLYPYLSTGNASYQYGEMIYEDSVLAVLSFYYKALEGRSLLAASFLASYEKATGTCLDMRPIFSSSTFDRSATLGYQLGLSCQSTLHYIDDGSAGILRLDSKVRSFYTAFEEGVTPRNNQVVTYQQVLLPSGQFMTRVVSAD